MLSQFVRRSSGVLIGALALLSALPPAIAAEEGWAEIATTARKKVLLKPASIRPHGEFVEAWTRYEYGELQKDVGKVPFRSSNYLTDYDCKGAREMTRRVVSHNGPLEAHDLDLSRRKEWRAVGGPTTVSGIVFKQVCAKASG